LLRRDVTPPGLELLNNRANIQPYLYADLVVSTCGQFLTDIYFPNKVGVLWQHYFLSQINTPFVIFAQTLGPFKQSPYRQMSRIVLNEADIIITRDEESKKVIEDLGVSADVHHTADAAFSMNLGKEQNTILNLINNKADRACPEGEIISVSVREWTHTDKGTEVNAYTETIARICDWLVREKNKKILFASTCTSLAGYNNDDRVMAARVMKRMEENDSAQILSGEYTPQELVDIYSQMDLHIGMRMHSNILAMMAETPIIAIEYQFKTEGLMKMFEIEEYLIDINDIDYESLRSLVEKGLENSDYIERSIQERLPEVEAKSEQSAGIIKNKLEFST
jgi:colanic acid/amylovoran biosynthesis protein